MLPECVLACIARAGHTRAPLFRLGRTTTYLSVDLYCTLELREPRNLGWGNETAVSCEKKPPGINEKKPHTSRLAQAPSQLVPAHPRGGRLANRGRGYVR